MFFAASFREGMVYCCYLSFFFTYYVMYGLGKSNYSCSI